MIAMPVFRTSVLALAGLLSIACAVPAGAQAPDLDQAVLAAPAGPSWDDASGYGALEASRVLAAPDDGARVGAAMVSRSVDLGSLQEEHLAAAPTDPSGIANHVPADARWAPADPSWYDMSGYGTVEAIRASIGADAGAALTAPHVSRTTDVGSLQEEYPAAPATTTVVVDQKFGPR